jgi:hypothetical protein
MIVCVMSNELEMKLKEAVLAFVAEAHLNI